MKVSTEYERSDFLIKQKLEDAANTNALDKVAGMCGFEDEKQIEEIVNTDKELTMEEREALAFGLDVDYFTEKMSYQ